MEIPALTTLTAQASTPPPASMQKVDAKPQCPPPPQEEAPLHGKVAAAPLYTQLWLISLWTSKHVPASTRVQRHAALEPSFTMLPDSASGQAKAETMCFRVLKCLLSGPAREREGSIHPPPAPFSHSKAQWSMGTRVGVMASTDKRLQSKEALWHLHLPHLP